MTNEDGITEGRRRRSSLGEVREFLVRHRYLVLLSMLIVFQIAVNWAWLSTNVVSLGWDRPRHLIESLVYDDILKQVDLRSLFEALTHSGYYPPLFHWSMAGFYKLFGVSMDVAAAVNLVYLALLLVSTYGIGKEIGARGVGLLAAFITSTLPMIFAMSRYTDIEFSLTAMVALSVWFLLLTRDFAHKGYSLLFGLSLGLGMLSKWTFSLFVVPCLVVVALRAARRSGARGGMRALSWDKRWFSISVALGLIVSAVWYLPNTTRVAELPLSHLLFPISWVLISGLIYLLTRPSSRIANLISALWLGLVVAGSWYLSRIDFIAHTFLIAWGRPERHSWAFGYYLDHLIYEQLSVFYMVILLLVGVGLLLLAWTGLRKVAGRKEAWKSDWLLLFLWIVVPYLVFGFRPSSRHSRFIMPILPALAVVMAYGLSKIRSSKMRVAAIAVIALVAIGQLLGLSFDGLDSLREAAIIGPVNLFAHKFQNQLPSSGGTDSRYWVVPDILSYVADDAESRGESLELGLLVNTRQVHDQHFLYLIYANYPQVTLRELAQNWTGRPAYPQLFEVDYVAVASDNPPHQIDAESLEVVKMLLEEPPALFQEAFERVSEYPFPDGNIIYLYKKRHVLPEGYEAREYEALARDLDTYLDAGDALVLHPSHQTTLLGRYYLGDPEALVLSDEEAMDASLIVRSLEGIPQHSERVVTVFEAGESEEVRAVVGPWLSEHCYPTRDAWYGPAHMSLYSCPQQGGEVVTERVRQVEFGGGISLLGHSVVPAQATCGDPLPLTLLWRADAEVGEDYKVFVHLISGEGSLVSQRDSEPVGGWQPTTTWQPGEVVRDNHGLVIPENIPEGEYEVVLGLYDLEGERLPVLDGAGQTVGDKISLGYVWVDDC